MTEGVLLTTANKRGYQASGMPEIVAKNGKTKEINRQREVVLQPEVKFIGGREQT